MKVVDLHPEDLLDKEARGELTESERARLDAHLERCVTCRFEREARDDFAAELEEDGAEISVQRLLAMVEEERKDGGLTEERKVSGLTEERKVSGLIEERKDGGLTEERKDGGLIEDEPAESEGPPPVAPSSRRGRRLVRVVALVAAALLVGGVATAQGGSRVWAQLSALWTDTPEVEVTARTAPPATPTTTSFAAAAASYVRAPTYDAVEAPSAAPALAAFEEDAPPRDPRATAHATAPAESSKTLFDAMSEARRRGDYARALSLHRRLQAEYPRSREAHVSHATIGRLLLDRGDATGALESFDAYQARGPGALDEAVLVGRATALDRLGRSDEARASWQALLDAFPETPYAEHARTRTGGARVP